MWTPRRGRQVFSYQLIAVQLQVRSVLDGRSPNWNQYDRFGCQDLFRLPPGQVLEAITPRRWL